MPFIASEKLDLARQILGLEHLSDDATMDTLLETVEAGRDQAIAAERRCLQLSRQLDEYETITFSRDIANYDTPAPIVQDRPNPYAATINTLTQSDGGAVNLSRGNEKPGPWDTTIQGIKDHKARIETARELPYKRQAAAWNAGVSDKLH